MFQDTIKKIKGFVNNIKVQRILGGHYKLFKKSINFIENDIRKGVDNNKEKITASDDKISRVNSILRALDDIVQTKPLNNDIENFISDCLKLIYNWSRLVDRKDLIDRSKKVSNLIHYEKSVKHTTTVLKNINNTISGKEYSQTEGFKLSRHYLKSLKGE